MYRNLPDFNKCLFARNGAFSVNNIVYVFSNENIPGYLDKLGDIAGKRILSVCASGDHAFECYLRDAKCVDLFDINYAQKNIMELKFHMIRNLPYEDFINFFFGKSRMNKDIISPLWNEFSDSLKIFYSYIYCSGEKTKRMCIPYSNNKLDNTKTYFSSREKYMDLARKLPEKINFSHVDLQNINTVITAKYDIVLLSNIFDYVCSGAKKFNVAFEYFYNAVLEPLIENNLRNKSGIIAFEYIWQGVGLLNPELLSRYSNWELKCFKKNPGKKLSCIEIEPASIGNNKDLVLLLYSNINAQKNR